MIQAANEKRSSSDRDIISTEVNSLKDELLSIANTRDVEGNFIFSGSKTGSQPFKVNGTTGEVSYEGDNRRLFTSVSDSRMLQSNTDGTQVFLPVSRTTTEFTMSGVEALVLIIFVLAIQCWNLRSKSRYQMQSVMSIEESLLSSSIDVKCQ